MKAIAYSVQAGEKEPIAVANKKKHDITLISNSLTLQTAEFARGKKAVIVYIDDQVSEDVIKSIAEMGVKYIATRSSGCNHIDLEAAKRYGICVSNVGEDLLDGIPEQQLPHILAEQTIVNLDKWQLFY